VTPKTRGRGDAKTATRLLVKRAYEEPAGSDGFRVLVDRLWPRGLTKEKAKVDLWLRDIAPSNELRRWYGHVPERWSEFKRRYYRELAGAKEALATLRGYMAKGKVTLVFSSKEEKLNNAVALAEYLGR
jgi:uncharacterized protein YeaO (DUF488 family)